jgi:DNA-3-methyladenine glycosylase
MASPAQDDPGSLPAGAPLGPEFFARPSDAVAPDLIGKILWMRGVGAGRLTEVEAYLPWGDPASHSACGSTARNAAMFGPPGSIYVFFSYGVHYLLNLVCDAEGVGSAVLLRALEPLGEGGAHGPATYCGPGRLGARLGVAPGLNGSMLGEESGLFVLDDCLRPQVGISTRIGITRGAALLLRYHAVDSRCVTHRGRTRKGPDS